MRLAHELDVLTAICTQIKNGEGGGVGGGKDVTKAGMPDFNYSTGFRDQKWDLGSVKLQAYKGGTCSWKRGFFQPNSSTSQNTQLR